MTSFTSPLHAVISIFSGPLQGVRFADIDGDGLSTLATEVESLASEVEEQEAQLTALRETLAQKQETLLNLAQQALAYARIYAENDEALSAELNEIALPRGSKTRKSAGVKAPSERGARASKGEADGNAESGALDGAIAEAEPAEVNKPRRKAAGVEAEPKAEAEVPSKAGRRKLPTRSARAAR
jgi:hypothetical protein